MAAKSASLASAPLLAISVTTCFQPSASRSWLAKSAGSWHLPQTRIVTSRPWPGGKGSSPAANATADRAQRAIAMATKDFIASPYSSPRPGSEAGHGEKRESAAASRNGTIHQEPEPRRGRARRQPFLVQRRQQVRLLNLVLGHAFFLGPGHD